MNDVEAIPTQGEGYYWIRLEAEPDRWIVAEWAVGGWWRCGSDVELNNPNFSGTMLLEIGDRITR